MSINTTSTNVTLLKRKGNTLEKQYYETSAEQVKITDSNGDPSDLYTEVETLRNDASNYVTINSVQTITGPKTFNTKITIGAVSVREDREGVLLLRSSNLHNSITMSDTSVTKGIAPESERYCCHGFYGNAITEVADRLGLLEHTLTTGNVSKMTLIAYGCKTAKDTTMCRISCNVDADDNVYTEAPTPAVDDNTTKIATTAWVRTATGNTNLNAVTATKAERDASDNIITSTYAKLSGNQTFTGSITVPNSFSSTVAVAASNIDVSTGSVFTKTVTADTTFTFSGVPSGKAARFTLVLTNGGSSAVTWPTSVKWSGGNNPALSTSGTDVIIFITPDGGTTWYGKIDISNAS